MGADIEMDRKEQEPPRRGGRGWLMLGVIVVTGIGLGYLGYRHFQSSPPTPLATFGDRIEVTCLAFTQDGKVLVTGELYGGLKVWDVARLKGQPTLRWQNNQAVSALALTADGKTLVVSSREGVHHDYELKLWDVPTGIERATLRRDGPGQRNWTCVAITADGKTVAAGSTRGLLVLWEVATLQPRDTLQKPPDWGEAGVNAVAFAPDGKILASGGEDGTLRLWDVDTGKQRLTLKGHDGMVGAVTFMPDGSTLISSGFFDHTIKLWDVATGKRKSSWQRVGQPKSLSITADGTTLVSDDDGLPGRVRLWDVATGRLRASLTPGFRLGAATITADGKILALGCGSPHFRVELWEASVAEPAPRDGVQPK